MVNRDGQYKARIPTQYKRSKGKNKNISIDGDIKRKCPSCGKARTLIVYAKPQNINEHDPYLYHVSRCTNCKYIHIELVSNEQ